jgi:cytochrome c oxidase cbb3-type subunit 2
MPNYAWLLKNSLEYNDIEDRMRALKLVGVPYSETQSEYDENVKTYGKEVADKLDISQAKDNLLRQVAENNYDGDHSKISEMDALVAYLQVLGTMVDFKQFEDGYFATFR